MLLEAIQNCLPTVSLLLDGVGRVGAFTHRDQVLALVFDAFASKPTCQKYMSTSFMNG
jgi:hypothetical protein